MTPETFPEPDDDPAFLACVDRIIAGLIERQSPDEVYLVRVANWFDHKWLRFSGKGRVPFPASLTYHTALDRFSQESVTFPPFTPNRVLTQHDFGRTILGDFEDEAPARLVHRRRREHSAKNLQRRVADFAESAVFVWFSSHSASNRRGSVMAYSVRSRTVDAWYAALRDDHGWQLGRVKGIDRQLIESFLSMSRRSGASGPIMKS